MGEEKRRHQAEREAQDWTEQTAFEPGTNQRRDEPMPASRHDDRRQEAEVRSEEQASGQAPARPSPRAPSGREGRGDPDGPAG
jgi:hypothetical protein